MAKGKPNLDWKRWVLAWKKSGSRPAAWCKENNIPYTTFLGWRNRFNKTNHKQSFTASKTAFIELKDRVSQDSGVFLDYHGIKIHLEPGFNIHVLQQCIACLRGVAC